ncbi:MAG: DUF192 domain-containing protein [Deltaproteobacteria bacterium]|nr:DUF192 domain-containing protein [Deltaproteobacteria bacterium]
MRAVLLALTAAACTRPPATAERTDTALQAAPVAAPPGPDLSSAPALFRSRGEVRIAGRPDGPVVRVELARSPEEREQGLMYRRSLADGAGMLFFMPDLRPWRFWMRNTLIPLDMVFVGEDWRVAGVVARAQPLTETGRGVAEPSRYVLEIGAGQAEALHIERGTALEFRELVSDVGHP